MAENAVEALFLNEKQDHQREKDVHAGVPAENAFGEVCHPNAARYMLYLAKLEMNKRLKNANSTLNNVTLPCLELYAPDANDAGMFDVKHSRKKVEVSLDELCEAELNPISTTRSS